MYHRDLLDLWRGRMTPRKAGVLAARIVSDPATLTGAAFREWDEPASRERLVLMDLHDLTHAVAVEGKDYKPYPRPWRDPNQKGRTTRTREEVLAILNAHGHHFDEG